jgi:hypothetical protein
MADTLPNILVPPNVWVNLYAQSGVVVGTRICVQNIGCHDVLLVTQELEPTLYQNHRLLVRGQIATNEKGDSGAWAYSFAGGLVNVMEVK